MIGIALAVMIAAVIAHHLGFVEEAYRVAGKIAGCIRCTTFWITLLALIEYSCDPIPAAVLSFFAAYLSHWVDLLLGRLAEIYDRIWQRLNKQGK